MSTFTAASGMVRSNGFQFKSSKKKNMLNRMRVSCSSSVSMVDPYKTLKIQPGASESEVKKAFRQLALQVLLSVSIFFFHSLLKYFAISGF